jgi:menaquinone-dependent protoporphyrinogen IX oxidase
VKTEQNTTNRPNFQFWNFSIEDANRENQSFFCIHLITTILKELAMQLRQKINASIIDVSKNIESIEFETYDLAVFGAGIDSGKHYPQMLEYVERWPEVQNKKAFIFSTSAVYSDKKC